MSYIGNSWPYNKVSARRNSTGGMNLVLGMLQSIISCSFRLLHEAPNILYYDIYSFQPMEIYVDDEAKLTLHGLVQVFICCILDTFFVDLMLCFSSHLCIVQHYIKLTEMEKNRKLNDLLDALDFNQVVIFVKSVNRAAELNKLLVECNFPSICIHSGMSQEERLVRLHQPLLASMHHITISAAIHVYFLTFVSYSCNLISCELTPKCFLVTICSK